MLGGCVLGGGTEGPTVRVISTTSYPDLPDLPPVDPLNLNNPQYDLPRDLAAEPVVKNLSTCINVPEDERNRAFWSRCGESPVISDTNIYRGFDYDNWIMYLENMNRIREYIKQYQDRIDQVNKQRQQWRELNEAEKERARKERENQSN